jgi:hypothetical protein
VHVPSMLIGLVVAWERKEIVVGGFRGEDVSEKI